jgi:hypothetical protein
VVCKKRKKEKKVEMSEDKDDGRKVITRLKFQNISQKPCV